VATASGVGCGNLNPRGIVGTPIIDAQTRTIYAVGAMGPGATTRYEAHALSIDDGSERAGWPAVIDGKVNAGGMAFDPHPHNQRGALSLVGGILYVPFGGHDGDCGNYHGWVVAIDTKNPTTIAAWATKGAGGAVWASGGMASDGGGVFATTGNGYGAGGTNLDSEAVVRLTGMASVNRAGNADIFYPNEWKALDAGDDDLGATPNGSGHNVAVLPLVRHQSDHFLVARHGGFRKVLLNLIDEMRDLFGRQFAPARQVARHLVPDLVRPFRHILPRCFCETQEGIPQRRRQENARVKHCDEID